MTPVELPALPSSRALRRRVVAGALHRRRRTSELPSSALVVHDVGVEIERLAAYNRVCGFRLTDALPATYPHVLVFPLAMQMMSEPSFPFAVVGLVHIANRITLVRPIEVGERLTVCVQAQDLREHDRGRQFDVEATASVDGDVVWRGVSTYLRRSGSTRRRAPAPAAAAETLTAIWPVGRDTGRAYAEVSGDHNPIHTSLLAARAFGFRRPIAHGMWGVARCLAAMEGRLPEAYEVDVAFKRPIPLPSTVGFSGGPAGFSLASTAAEPHLRGAVTA